MSTAMLMIGLPGSGKTTAAKAIVNGNFRWVRISRDGLRDMMFNGFKRKREEDIVLCLLHHNDYDEEVKYLQTD